MGSFESMPSGGYPTSSSKGIAHRSRFSIPTEWARGSGLGCQAWEVLFLVKPTCQSPAEFLKRFLWSHVFKNYWFHMTLQIFLVVVLSGSRAFHSGSVSRIFQVEILRDCIELFSHLLLFLQSLELNNNNSVTGSGEWWPATCLLRSEHAARISSFSLP